MDRMIDNTKLGWHIDVLDALNTNTINYPIHMDLGITKKCNLDCCFCYAKHQGRMNVEIDSNSLLNLIWEFSLYGGKSISFVGDGEPTVGTYFLDAIQSCWQYDIDYSISTNGINLSDKVKNEIRKTCKFIVFNINGYNSETYLKIHNKDYFNKVINNIKDLVGSSVDVGVKIIYIPTLMRSYLKEHVDFILSLGVDYISINQCSLPDDGESGIYQFDTKEYEKDIELLNSFNSNPKVTVKINSIYNQKKDYKQCLGSRVIAFVSGNGDWYPCNWMFGNPKYDEYKFGNIMKIGYGEIIESKKYETVLEKMKQFNIKECKGDCRLNKINRFIDTYINKPKNINFV